MNFQKLGLQRIDSPLQGNSMNLFSFNCRRLASNPQKLAFRRLFQVEKPHVIFLQETLRDGNNITKLLEYILDSQKFISFDVYGRSGGLAFGWDSLNIRVHNTWSITSSMGFVVFSLELGNTFTFINLYGPNVDSVSFYSELFRNILIDVEL